MKNQFFVTIGESKKSGRPYAMLQVDLGYATKAITFDSNLIAEIMQVSVHDLFAMGAGKYEIQERSKE